MDVTTWIDAIQARPAAPFRGRHDAFNAVL
jgi:hypothetical protein